MKMHWLATGLFLLASTLHAQERAALPDLSMAPEERPATPAPELRRERIATPDLEISHDKRIADEQARDIRDLKQQMTAYRQLLDNQQGQIAELRACLKTHDQILGGVPVMLPGAGKLGEHRIDKAFGGHEICKL